MRALGLAVLIACGGGSKPVDEAQLQPYWQKASGLMDRHTPDALKESIAALREAYALDPTNATTMGELEWHAGYAALVLDLTVDLPGFTPPTSGPASETYRLGRAARRLAQLKNARELGDIAQDLDKLAPNANVAWLRGKALQLEGNRKDAIALYRKQRSSLSAPDFVQALADENRVSDAIELTSDYAADAMAALARATVRAEAGIQLSQAAKDLEHLPATTPGLLARVEVARLLIALAGERYDLVAASLKKLGSAKTMPNDCWMWARIAFAYQQLARAGEGGRSDFRAATVTRGKCELPKASPLLAVVDAGNQLAIGNYEPARQIAGLSSHPWAAVIEAHAALELGDAEGAARIAKREASESPPANAALAAVGQAATTLLARGKKTELEAELAKLDTITGKSQRGRHLHGATLFALGDLAGAKQQLRRAVEDTSPASPNPFGHRTRSLLAEIAIAEHDFALARKEIEQALAIHEGNRHTKSIQAQIELRDNDPEKALALLALLRKSGELPALAQLVVAEALVVRKAVTADERAQARTLVTGLVGKIAPAELGRVAALVDPQLPKELKLPVGKPPGKGT